MKKTKIVALVSGAVAVLAARRLSSTPPRVGKTEQKSRRRVFTAFAAALLCAFAPVFTACDNGTNPAPSPEVTDFTFTQTPDLKTTYIGTLSGDVAGTFSAPVGGTAPFFYMLVSGDGDWNNNTFSIDGTSLIVGESPLSAGSYSARVQIVDNNGKKFAKACVVNVLNADGSAPDVTGFTFTGSASLKATDPIGTVAGTFSAPVGGTAPFAYALATGSGTNDADNSKFTISGDELKTAAILTAGIKNIYVEVTDANNKTYGQGITVDVIAGTQKTIPLDVAGFTPVRAVTDEPDIAAADVSGNTITLTAGYDTGDFTVYVYDADHYEVPITGLSVASDGTITGTPEPCGKSEFPIYNMNDTAGGSVFDAVKNASPGDHIQIRGTVSSYPTADSVTGKSSWEIPADVTLELAYNSTMHMHIVYNSTGEGIFKVASGSKVMLPGASPTSGSFQVSTLEIGGTLWLGTPITNTNSDLIYGMMTSPGGIVRLLPGSDVKFDEADGTGVEAITVDNSGEGGAYFHTIAKNLIIGSSTVTIKDTITLGAVSGSEKETYTSQFGTISMDSTALGLGTKGTLVIDAPDKTVTVASIDAKDINKIDVKAGTLAVTGSVTNASGKVTIESGANMTVNGEQYTPTN